MSIILLIFRLGKYIPKLWILLSNFKEVLQGVHEVCEFFSEKGISLKVEKPAKKPIEKPISVSQIKRLGASAEGESLPCRPSDDRGSVGSTPTPKELPESYMEKIDAIVESDDFKRILRGE